MGWGVSREGSSAGEKQKCKRRGGLGVGTASSNHARAAGKNERGAPKNGCAAKLLLYNGRRRRRAEARWQAGGWFWFAA